MRYSCLLYYLGVLGYTYFQQVRKAYKTLLGEDEVIVGDLLDTVFHPQMKLTRWNKEAWLTLKFDDAAITGKKTVFAENEQVKWDSSKIAITFYPKPPDAINEGGTAEFEIILKSKPSTTKIYLPIERQNLTFHYQPAFTEIYNPVDCLELSETHVLFKNGRERWRPSNVVGSYAVYHTSKKNGAYKTGKAFHIYRPKLIDATNKMVWADLNISANTLTITLPQDFLNSAVYPVTIDPTFGYTSIGGSSGDAYINSFPCAYSPANMPEAGNVTDIKFYGNVASGTITAYCALYLTDSATPAPHPTTKQGTTGQVTINTTLQWWTFNFSPSISQSAGNKGLAIGQATGSVNYYYDDGSENQMHIIESATLPDSWGTCGAHLWENWSIYADYTVAAKSKGSIAMQAKAAHII